MSFCVAVQSAVFYLVSCAPCLQARHHQQSKVKAKQERKEKGRLQTGYAGSYQQPDPFNTNPYWSEEIMMGPHSDVRKYTGGASKNTSQRGLNSAGKAPASVAGSNVGVDGTNPETSPSSPCDDGKLSFSTTLSTNYSDDWNRKRYQREDEELWGHDISRTHKLMDAIKHAGSSAGRLLEVSLGMEMKSVSEEDRHNFYFAPKNPPVNDYHPPIVRQLPTHRDAHKWMLQPPPAAKVMEGKVPVSRSASFASHMSRRATTTSDTPTLGRLVHEKTVEAKLRSGEVPADIGSTPSLNRPRSKRQATTSSVGTSNTRANRSRSLSVESSDLSDELNKRRRSRVRPTFTPELDSSSEEEYFLRSTSSSGRGKRAAVRPRLQPIASSQASEKASKDKLSKKRGELASGQAASSPLADVSNSSDEQKPEQPAALSAPPKAEASQAQPTPVASS
ncbi:hypothetical protein F4780DRAFT_338501 [Xylariomycetidae sp. FL0641]|nr:hypothetical protein F4780DRAFT_338501 [Xylariomycetidae sp. FL0641]